MGKSQIGRMAFTSGGQDYALRYGFSAVARVEAEFGCGFLAALMAGLPDIKLDAARADDPAYVEAMTREAGKAFNISAVCRFWRCGLEPQVPDDDDFAALVDALGYARIVAMVQQGAAAALVSLDNAGGPEGNGPKARSPIQPR